MALSKLFVELGFEVDQRSVVQAERSVQVVTDQVKVLARQATLAAAAISGVVTGYSAGAAKLSDDVKTLGVKNLESFRADAEYFGGQIDSIFARFADDIRKKDAGLSSEEFYAYYLGVSDPVEALKKTFADIQGLNREQAEAALALRGFGLEERNIFFDRQGQVQTFAQFQAGSARTGAAAEQANALKEINESLKTLKDTFDRAIIEKIAQNSDAIVKFLGSLNISLEKFTAFAAENWKLLLTALTGISLILKAESIKRETAKTAAESQKDQKLRSETFKQTSFLRDILKVNTQILNTLRAQSGVGGGSSRRGRTGGSGRTGRTGGTSTSRGSGRTFSSRGTAGAVQTGASFTGRLLSTKNIVAALALYFAEEFAGPGGPLSFTSLFGDSSFAKALDTPIGDIIPQSPIQNFQHQGFQPTNFEINIDARGSNPTETEAAVKKAMDKAQDRFNQSQAAAYNRASFVSPVQ